MKATDHQQKRTLRDRVTIDEESYIAVVTQMYSSRPNKNKGIYRGLQELSMRLNYHTNINFKTKITRQTFYKQLKETKTIQNHLKKKTETKHKSTPLLPKTLTFETLYEIILSAMGMEIKKTPTKCHIQYYGKLNEEEEEEEEKEDVKSVVDEKKDKEEEENGVVDDDWASELMGGEPVKKEEEKKIVTATDDDILGLFSQKREEKTKSVPANIHDPFNTNVNQQQYPPQRQPQYYPPQRPTYNPYQQPYGQQQQRPNPFSSGPTAPAYPPRTYQQNYNPAMNNNNNPFATNNKPKKQQKPTALDFLDPLATTTTTPEKRKKTLNERQQEVDDFF